MIVNLEDIARDARKGGSQVTDDGKTDGVDYEGAARQQLNWLLYHTPKSNKGAISHRQDELQYW